MTAKYLPLVLSLFSLGIIIQNYFQNINLIHENASCTDRLRKAVGSSDVLQQRLNETESQIRLRKSVVHEQTMRAAEERGNLEHLLDIEMNMQQKLKTRRRQAKGIEAKTEQEMKHRSKVESSADKLLNDRDKLLAEIDKTKSILKTMGIQLKDEQGAATKK